MAPLPHPADNAFLRDLRALQEAVAPGVVPARASAAAAAQWNIWENFCAALPISPSLQDLPDPIRTSKSLPTSTDMASLVPLGALSAGAPWKVPYTALAKRLQVWGPWTHASLHKATLTSGSSACWPVTPRPMTRPIA